MSKGVPETSEGEHCLNPTEDTEIQQKEEWHMHKFIRENGRKEKTRSKKGINDE